MNLRNISDDYSIGLDMGTGSVGWAVGDVRGQLFHFKRQPTWGSRLFDSANTAAMARMPRSQRRRYVRRRWRLDLLQSLFQDEIEKVDPEFFIRLRQSRLIKEDRAEGHRDYGHPLFNDSDFTEREYYKRFPTIYHLRKWLMKTDGQADIRLIYLAIHNIVKHRGNFLREEQKSLSAKTAKPDVALHSFFEALNAWCATRGYELVSNRSYELVIDVTAKILGVLADEKAAPTSKKKDIRTLLGVSMGDDSAANRRCNDALAAGMVGLKAEFKNVFGEFQAEKTAIHLSNDEDVDALREACPDDSIELFNRLCDVYSAYVLQGLLSYAPGETISVNMVEKYEQYGKDLALLKELVRRYASKSYDSFFRGPTYPDTNIYDASKAKGYTKYNLGTSKLSYDDFSKEVKSLLGKTDAVNDERYQSMMEAFDKQQFLRRLKTSDNGSIYYQLHFEELQAILKTQGRFYPFLKTDEKKIESLVSFRIPYYVGPLSSRNAAVDQHGKQRFAWAERKPGQEDTPITPWNWDSVIDRNKSAEKFIKRMTGMCTYLQGEEVLPRCSLLYEEFCVLNELNGLRLTIDGDREHRLDTAQREGIVHDLFHHKRSVSYKQIEDWIIREEGFRYPHISGGQGVSGLESKMGSYIFFCKDVFGVDELDRKDYDMVEEIILWNTLFEDRRILKEKLVQKYGEQAGGPLSDEQIKRICKKRFTGWGRLSEKFLIGLKVKTDVGPKSIMDVLREGDPNSDSRRGHAMVMMEALRDENLGFQKRVDEFNRNYFEANGKLVEINELPGSPAIRRSLNQAMRIVDEIAKIAGHAPANIFIEVTRDDDERKKGRRTTRRYDELKKALEAFKSDDPEIWREICETAPKDLDERLTLYFMQRGKCLYSGRPIDMNRLAESGLYEVDHIIPRAYIKDDSFENKALVYREENQRKTDALLIDQGVRRKMHDYWNMLHDAKLIGDKKYNNLMRSTISEQTMKGFVARQLVETSQMVKLVQSMLEVRYPETKIVPVKASISHNLREAAGFIKCREANDFHHAHDAYLALRVGMFIQKRHPGVYENPIGLTRAMRKYAQSQAEIFRSTHHLPGSAGFIVNSFMSSGFDKETGEIFKDDWDAEAEVEGIRRALNFRQCFISRMPYEDTGVFWDATIYSPRDQKKKPVLPLKNGLDPQKYGGFSREQFAYFFVYEARKPRGNKPLFRFAQVPVWLARRMEGDSSALESYARGLAANEKLEYVGIERAKILKRQLIEIDGDRLIVTGIKEARNGRELAFNSDELALINRLINGQELDDDGQLDKIWDRLLCLGDQMGSHLASRLKLINYKKSFINLDYRLKSEIILGLIKIANAANNVVDLSAVGGVKNAGRILLTYTRLLSDSNVDFYIIDQSVTGMFERRTRIGL